jgi:hypothetical protein
MTVRVSVLNRIKLGATYRLVHDVVSSPPAAAAAASACHYACSTGYTLTAPASICGRAGTWLQQSTCRPFPPVFTDLNQTFSVPERSVATTLLAPPVLATVADPRITLTFGVAEQGPSPYVDTFDIGLCSGNLIVTNAANLDLTLSPSPAQLWVNISAMAAQDPWAVSYAVRNVVWGSTT